MQYSEELKKSLSSMSMVTLSKSKQPDISSIRDEVIKSTSFLDCIDNIKLTTRVYCINNEISSIPLCKNCHKNTVPNKLNNALGFSKFCSIECSRHSTDIDDDKIKFLSDYEWMYSSRITNKKSWDDIALEIGVSHITVKKYAYLLKIPDVNYNKSDPSISTVLENKVAMEELYSSKSIYVISDELGVSPSFVNVWLNKHGIEAKPSNSYPRKKLSVSGECQSVIDFIKENYNGDIIINDRSLLGDGRELDIVIPEMKLAIEYNGVWSHLYRPWESNESSIKGINYHRSKATMCRDRGYKLFMIWSDDWKSKRDIIKSMILTKLGLVNQKVFARKCTIVRLEKSQAKNFLDENHLQGKDNATHYIGLKNGNDLIAVMSFGRSRYNKKYEWELSRFSIMKGISVPGGFSRLLKSFTSEFKGNIISYADFDHSHGDVYMKNGFVKIRENKASYWYVKKNSELMEHRFKYRKGNISKEGDTRTEWEIMQSNGYNKVFDCGTISFGLDN